MIAFLRPDSWDLPLFVHVLGAISLFGGVAALVMVSYAGLKLPQHAPWLRSLAFRLTLLLVWPAYIVMRAGAQWIFEKEDLDPDMPTWIGLGIAVGDGGALVLIGLTALGWFALQRRPAWSRYFTWLAAAYLVALGVAWWAMSAKPGA